MTGACLLRRSDRVELYADKRSLWSVGGLMKREDASRSSLKDLDVEITSEDKFLGCGSNDRKEGVEFLEKALGFAE